MAAAVRVRIQSLSLIDILAGLCLVASVASPWAISIPPAHLVESFGFQTPLCWLVVAALIGAVLLKGHAAIVALAAAELAVIGWFGWAMWVDTTPRFTSLGFPFIGTDLIGPGWYAAAVGLLVVGGVVVKKLNDRDVPVDWDLWVLAAIPGYGLARLGQWGRGLMWTVLVAAAFYFASTDSPDPAQFLEFGRTGNVPTSYPRSPEWVLLTVAALLWLAAIALTALQQRRRLGVIDHA